MHPFKKLCKHAQEEISLKFTYSEREKDEAGGCCWQCGKPLTEEKIIHCSTLEELRKYVSLDETVEDAIKEKPTLVNELLDLHNAPRFKCYLCFMAMLDKSKLEDAILLDDVIADWENPNGEWKQRYINNIKEVEECGPDCPWWDRLEGWRKSVEEAY